MTIGERHQAIASQYFKEKEKAKWDAEIRHMYGDTIRPDKEQIKKSLKKMGFKDFSHFVEYINDQDVF